VSLLPPIKIKSEKRAGLSEIDQASNCKTSRAYGVGDAYERADRHSDKMS
jgi:hypothetical protein